MELIIHTWTVSRAHGASAESLPPAAPKMSFSKQEGTGAGGFGGSHQTWESFRSDSRAVTSAVPPHGERVASSDPSLGVYTFSSVCWVPQVLQLQCGSGRSPRGPVMRRWLIQGVAPPSPTGRRSS